MIRVCLLLTACLAALLVPAPAGVSADEPGTYANEDLGIRARSPAGWQVNPFSEQPMSWVGLVTFFDPKTEAEATLSVRKRDAADLATLEAKVRKEWAGLAGDGVSVQNIQRILSTALMPNASVVVDATHAKMVPAQGNQPPSRRTTRIQANYYLSGGNEYLLYAKAPSTLWSRIRPGIEQIKQSLDLGNRAASAPKGEGSYRDEMNGFTCRFPKGHTVVVPQRSRHLVSFEGLSADDPLISIYRVPWKEGAPADAARLVEYYVDELAGEASTASTQIGGRAATLVRAKARIRGVDLAIWIAIIARDDHVMRLRVTVPETNEKVGQAVFDAFAASFELGAS